MTLLDCVWVWLIIIVITVVGFTSHIVYSDLSNQSKEPIAIVVEAQEPMICSTSEHTERQYLTSYEIKANDVVDLVHGGVYYVGNCSGEHNEL